MVDYGQRIAVEWDGELDESMSAYHTKQDDREQQRVVVLEMEQALWMVVVASCSQAVELGSAIRSIDAQRELLVAMRTGCHTKKQNWLSGAMLVG